MLIIVKAEQKQKERIVCYFIFSKYSVCEYRAMYINRAEEVGMIFTVLICVFVKNEIGKGTMLIMCALELESENL